jgi:lipopolysaccharide transport system ATP-binding protein
MSSELAIEVVGLSKRYRIFQSPHHRLTQGLLNYAARTVRPGRLADRLRNKAANVAHVHDAIEDVSFHVRRGEALAIIGRNGSGKSTILQMICQTLEPSGGGLRVTGRLAALLELGSGFNPEFTGRENVYLNGQLLGLTRRQISERMQSIQDFAGIESFFDEPVRTYSSGMFVRLAFAVIAHVDADILIIDEALAVGDAAFNQKCMRFLREFMSRGTLLFVSHDLGSVKALCERAIWLDHGKLRMDGSAKVVADAYLRDLFETHQGASNRSLAAPKPVTTSVQRRDARIDLLNRTSLRNDLVVHQFDLDAPGFGRGAARIRHVAFVGENGEALNVIVGGEAVRLEILVKTSEALDSPIVGFFVRDRLGQELFGDNTFLSSQQSPVAVHADETFKAAFEFEMPRLPRGSYSIVVAVADGTQAEHVQHHWINDAITFESHTTSVAQGLVGIPMREVALTKSGLGALTA